MNTGDEVGGGEVAKARRLRRPPPCCGSDLRSVNRLDVSGVILSSFKNRFLAKAVLFLYACPGDVLPQYPDPVSLRVGFCIHQLHFVVLLPLLRSIGWF